jgi:transcription initiation factor TFIIB
VVLNAIDSNNRKALSSSGGPVKMFPIMEDASNQDPWKDNLSNILMCPDCKENPPNLIEEFSSGDMVCGSCGVVVGDRIIDSRSEWRTFANDDQGNDDPSRVGEAEDPLLSSGPQLATRVGEGSNAQGHNLKRVSEKAAKADRQANGQSTAYSVIQSFCDTMSTGAVVTNTAKHIFKLADEAKFLKGKPVEAIIAGCIFIACRQNGVPRTFREIYALTRVSKKEIGRVFKALEGFIQKHNAKNPNDPLGIQNYEVKGSTGADELCARYCSQLGFRNPQRIEKISSLLAAKTSSVPDLAGRSPLSVAAACIYFSSHLMGEPKSSKEIASVAGVSDGTIKTAYKFLHQARERLVDPEWLVNGQGSMDQLPVN